MAVLKSLITKKSKRLKEVPEEFLSSVEKYQKKLFVNVLALLDNLKRDGSGRIIFSSEDLSNLNVIQSIEQDIKTALLSSDYVKAVDSYAQEFNEQARLTSKYFKDLFESFQTSPAAEAVLARAKENAVTLLIGEPLDTNFLLPVKSLLEDSVQSGASWVDTVQSIRDYVEGNEDADGRLLKYAKQIAHDEFAITDRSVTNIIAEEVEAEWYFYSGGEVLATRCFCDERNGQYFHWKEIAAWGEGQNLGKCDLGDGTWAGERDGTNAQTIFVFAGGWNCMHSINPVSVFDVPMEVVQRNIANGNYSPSEKEAELLGV